MNNLENLLNEATVLFDSIDNINDLEQAKARYLGKSGALTEILKGLKNLSPEERPIVGGQINKLKEELETRLNEYWIDRNQETESYEQYAVLHKHEEGQVIDTSLSSNMT